MNKKNSSKYDYLINEYPAVITKDQFYRICNISKKTAKHLLDNGLVPCINSGKKTRKYKLKLTDVIVYLEARDASPEIYTAPIGWYKRGSTYKGHKREPRVLTEKERKHIINYAKTKEVYSAYRQSGFSAKYYEANTENILLHQSAKQGFDSISSSKIPSMRDLQQEFNSCLDSKKVILKDYASFFYSFEIMLIL